MSNYRWDKPAEPSSLYPLVSHPDTVSVFRSLATYPGPTIQWLEMKLQSSRGRMLHLDPYNLESIGSARSASGRRYFLSYALDQWSPFIGCLVLGPQDMTSKPSSLNMPKLQELVLIDFTTAPQSYFPKDNTSADLTRSTLASLRALTIRQAATSDPLGWNHLRSTWPLQTLRYLDCRLASIDILPKLLESMKKVTELRLEFPTRSPCKPLTLSLPNPTVKAIRLSFGWVPSNPVAIDISIESLECFTITAGWIIRFDAAQSGRLRHVEAPSCQLEGLTNYPALDPAPSLKRTRQFQSDLITTMTSQAFYDIELPYAIDRNDAKAVQQSIDEIVNEYSGEKPIHIDPHRLRNDGNAWRSRQRKEAVAYTLELLNKDSAKSEKVGSLVIGPHDLPGAPTAQVAANLTDLVLVGYDGGERSFYYAVREDPDADQTSRFPALERLTLQTQQDFHSLDALKSQWPLSTLVFLDCQLDSLSNVQALLDTMVELKELHLRFQQSFVSVSLKHPKLQILDISFITSVVPLSRAQILQQVQSLELAVPSLVSFKINATAWSIKFDPATVENLSSVDAPDCRLEGLPEGFRSLEINALGWSPAQVRRDPAPISAFTLAALRTQSF